MNPIEVDTQLAEMHGRYWTLCTRRAGYNKQKRAGSDYYAPLLAEVEEQIQAVLAEMSPLEELYAANPWTRAFVVPDGHVHRSMTCSTCYPTTEFGWVTNLSGATEAEIIEAAGSRACTVCYPNAPVDAPAGRIFHASEEAAEKARQERRAKQAAAAAKKAANAVGPYRTSDRDLIETVYAAKAFLTDGFEWGWDHPSYSLEDRDAVAGLLAAKLGTTPEEQLEAAAKRAKNR